MSTDDLSTSQARPIKALLLDADGVVQFTADVLDRLSEVLGGQDVVWQLWALERTALDGTVDFAPILAEFLASKGRPDAVPELLAIWHNIEPYPGADELIAQVRADGVTVALGTNQQNVRGQHMLAELPYQQYFDQQFYSFQLGVAKPDPGFFTVVASKLGVDPAQVLFVDDMEENVEGARAAGMQAAWHDRETGIAGLRAILTGHGLLAA